MLITTPKNKISLWKHPTITINTTNKKIGNYSQLKQAFIMGGWGGYKRKLVKLGWKLANKQKMKNKGNCDCDNEKNSATTDLFIYL
jgi:hypothetical protein